MARATVFDLSDVSFGYRSTIPALSGVSCRILAGEKISVVGANGAGKTTLLKLLAGQLAPSSGRLQTPESGGGEQGTGSHVALVSSNFHTTLSEGQKKRVSLSAMLALQPPVILLDEPMAGLDAIGRRWFIDIVKELKKLDKTVVVATHDLVLAELAADRLLVLGEDHRVLADGPLPSVLKDTALLIRAGLLHAHVHTHEGSTHQHLHPLSSHEDDDHDHRHR